MDGGDVLPVPRSANALMLSVETHAREEAAAAADAADERRSAAAKAANVAGPIRKRENRRTNFLLSTGAANVNAASNADKSGLSDAKSSESASSDDAKASDAASVNNAQDDESNAVAVEFVTATKPTLVITPITTSTPAASSSSSSNSSSSSTSDATAAPAAPAVTPVASSSVLPQHPSSILALAAHSNPAFGARLTATAAADHAIRIFAFLPNQDNNNISSHPSVSASATVAAMPQGTLIATATASDLAATPTHCGLWDLRTARSAPASAAAAAAAAAVAAPDVHLGAARAAVLSLAWHPRLPLLLAGLANGEVLLLGLCGSNKSSSDSDSADASASASASTSTAQAQAPLPLGVKVLQRWRPHSRFVTSVQWLLPSGAGFCTGSHDGAVAFFGPALSYIAHTATVTNSTGKPTNGDNSSSSSSLSANADASAAAAPTSPFGSIPSTSEIIPAAASSLFVAPRAAAAATAEERAKDAHAEAAVTFAGARLNLLAKCGCPATGLAALATSFSSRSAGDPETATETATEKKDSGEEDGAAEGELVSIKTLKAILFPVAQSTSSAETAAAIGSRGVGQSAFLSFVLTGKCEFPRQVEALEALRPDGEYEADWARFHSPSAGDRGRIRARRDARRALDRMLTAPLPTATATASASSAAADTDNAASKGNASKFELSFKDEHCYDDDSSLLAADELPAGYMACPVLPPKHAFLCSIREDKFLYVLDWARCCINKTVDINKNAWDDHVSFTLLSLAAAPKGYLVAAATDKHRVVLYDVVRNAVVNTYFGGVNGDMSTPKLAWGGLVNSNSNGGKDKRANLTGLMEFLACSTQDNEVYVWHSATAKVVTTLKGGHSHSIRALVPYPPLPLPRAQGGGDCETETETESEAVVVATGGFLTGGFDKTVKLWTHVGTSPM